MELARYLNLELTVPSRITGATKTKEQIYSGSGSTVQFDLNQSYLIGDTLTVSYGSAEASATNVWTITTDYTADLDSGIVTPTATGMSKSGSDPIFAVYSYNAQEIPNTLLQEALDRAQADVDEDTKNHFATGTDATPDYAQITNEKHDGKGQFDRGYYLRNFPLPDVSTVLTSASTASTTFLTVTSTNGFQSSGVIGVENDKITYTGKTTTKFTGCTGTTSAHATPEPVFPFVVEVSTTGSGNAPTWNILDSDVDFDMDIESGRVHLYNTNYQATYYDFKYPPRMMPNRFRATYQWGTSTIPSDIKRLTLMIAAKDFVHGTLRNNFIAGKSNERRENINIDEAWIENTKASHRNIQVRNV